MTLTLEKLIRAKKIMDANPCPSYFWFPSFRLLRRCGWKPIDIQRALDEGRLHKALTLPVSP